MHWFQQALDVEKQCLDDALNIVYENIDTMLWECCKISDFGEIDNFVKELNPEHLSTDMILAVLVNTKCESDRLPARQKFFEQSWKVLKIREKDAHQLMDGLDGKNGLAKIFEKVKRFFKDCC